MKVKKPLKSFFKTFLCYLFSITFIIGSGLTNTAFAKVQLPSGRDNEFAENNILFYNPDGNTDDCPPSRDGDALIIGDSITNGSKSEISKKLPKATIIAQDGKQFGGSVSSNPTGIEILKEQKSFPSTVVMALGTNGSVSQSQIDEAISIVGDETRLVLTTNYKLNDASHYDANNKAFKDAANSHSNVLVADWADAVKSDPSKYIHNNDGYAVHPTAEGTKLFAEVIADAVGGTSGGSSGGSDNGDSSRVGKLYNGDPVLSDDSIKKIQENKKFYMNSAKKYGFDWQIIAAIHYRESSLSRVNPPNGQGAYQLYTYTNGGKNSNAFLPAGPISDTEFQDQTDIMAKIIADKGYDLSTEDGIKTMFFSYNGTASAYKSQARSLGFDEAGANRGEGSPYVMNLADEKRDSRKNSNWKQISTDGGPMSDPANLIPGAFIIYQALGGMGSSCGGGNGDINKTALELAWPYEEKGKHDKFDPRPTYKVALADVGLNHYGEQWVEIGASCDAYVATVLTYSGVDPDAVKHCCGAANMLSYFQSSDKYEEITNSAENLKGGDIRNSSGHVEIYVEDNGVGRIASASHADRTAEVGNYYDNSFHAFRFKGGSVGLH